MTLRDHIRRLKAQRQARVGDCPGGCHRENVLLRKGPGNDRWACDFCWADTVPQEPAGDAARDPRAS